ncbi:aldehyde ferredoxin oxidoreductase [candidate division KSB3 bacterium]|uniref:Aldehyde ferredoxin oxidoreductase n=1 Tax=candidate division KSB3 bacterium TaxID=2044937 RepID=A0A9D5K113_9BACT|nr:aldehyde ferredoxin oxidoreductase [candidate division KSB3 bacterium]MBD3327476.1 aldehyde ferredoxin oxidoreductase [candidate division KSB3 bacterium]
MYGWIGNVLRVNLTAGTVKTEKLNAEWAKDYLGNRGLATRYFVAEVDPKVDPLSPDNKMIMVTGPMTGTLGTSTGRYEVITKGPLTGAIAASNSGGMFGAELKFAGFDMVIFEGASKKPVYLYIEDGKAELRDASHLWGKVTSEATDILVSETEPTAKVACIGPGGEKQSKIACIMNDKERATGRSGVGAVMGSKKLKAVVVVGSGAVTPADPDKAREVALNIRNQLLANAVTGEGLPTFGTPMLVNVMNQHGSYPTRNFQETVFEGAEATSGETLRDTLLVKNKACFGCTIACGRVTKVSEGPYAGYGEGPEYETDWAYGAMCGVDNLPAITKANYLCNEYGIDTISTGATIACAMELYEKGYMPKKDAGMEITFGNADAIVKLTEMIGKREGIGDKLAEGSYRLGEMYGHPELSMSAKKQEMPAYDPRGVQGMGLEYATSNRGGCHVRGYMVALEVLGDVPPNTVEGKDGMLKGLQDSTAVVDSAGICLFTTFGLGLKEVAAQLSAMTGVEYTEESLMECGDRIYNLERLFNLKAGLTKDDDTLPPRMLKEPIPSGPRKGEVNRLSEMLPAYYKTRGWDENGVPTPEKLDALGLKDLKFGK